MGGTEQFTPAGVDCSGADWAQCYIFSKVTEAYDPKTGLVTRKRDMLHGRGDFAATLTNESRILVAGGETQVRHWYQLVRHGWHACCPHTMEFARHVLCIHGSAVYTQKHSPVCHTRPHVCRCLTLTVMDRAYISSFATGSS